MNPPVIGIAAFVCSVVGILFGLWLRATLPRAQFEGDAMAAIAQCRPHPAASA